MRPEMPQITPYLLTEPAIDTFGHVNVITCCAARSVSAGFGLYGNGLMDEEFMLESTPTTKKQKDK